jgi:imidazole glycerol-phosphate synthase subunit HisH
MIVVVDYGLGNLGSVVNMLKKVGARAKISSSVADVQSAETLILPGVGHFDWGMTNLRKDGLAEALTARVVERRVPILGICLGMQLFSKGSEEGQLDGLGWLDARVKKFQFENGTRLPVPHMGWNEVEPSNDVLFSSFEGERRFYFVHSYHVVCADRRDVAATCTYGFPFTAAVHRGHIYGTQFHPEKSHKFGMRLLESFVRATRPSIPEVHA